jgi:hypothetical protein
MTSKIWRGWIAALALALWTTPAGAVSFSFAGNFSLVDDDNDGFSELLDFDNPVGNHSGFIHVFDPGGDGLFADAALETVLISALTLDPSDPFAFDPTLYANGFAVYDDDGTLLFEADLTAAELVIDGGTGTINPQFELNLTNITAGGGYVGGSSAIIDAFLAAPGGAANVTLQVPIPDLGSAIQNGDSIASTFSGSATPIPEPASVLLVGAGLAGLARAGRARRS